MKVLDSYLLNLIFISIATDKRVWILTGLDYKNYKRLEFSQMSIKTVIFSKILRIFSLGMLVAVLGAGCASTGGGNDSAVKVLNDDEIRAAFTGKEYKYTGDSTGVQSWTADKTEWNDNTWGPGKARWWAKDNRYCYFFEGKNHCSVVTVENGVYSAGLYNYDSN